MAAQMFSESGQMQESDIPDIFDVLEGGEDESAVKFLLGFNAEDVDQQISSQQHQHQLLTTSQLPPLIATVAQPSRIGNFSSSSSVRKKSSESSGTSDSMLTKEGKPRKRDPVDPIRCIFSCESCAKAFTTKFNLKRHINLHCNKSKEAGVPVQGPPSASTPSRKAKERREAEAASGVTTQEPKTPSKKKTPKIPKPKPKSNLKTLKQQRRVSSGSQAGSVMSLTTAQSSNNQQHQLLVDQSRVKLPSFQNQQHTTTSYTINNSSNQQHISHLQQSSVSQSQQQQQQQQQQQLLLHQPQQQRVIHHQNNTVYQPLSDSTLHMIHNMGPLPVQQQLQQQQHPQQQQQIPPQQQQRQFFQQRIVRFVHPHQISQRLQQHTTAIVGQFNDRQFLQQGANRGVYQAIPVSIVSTGGGRGLVPRAIQLPQQPLPVLHALPTTTVGSFKASTTVSAANGQLPIMAANVSSFMPKFAATAVATHQRAYVQPLSNDIYIRPTNVLSTSTAIVSSPYLQMPNVSTATNLENELCCPPDELFDSEDGDASSVATPTSENHATSAVKSLPSIKSITDKNNVDDSIGIVDEDDGEEGNDESPPPLMACYFESSNVSTSLVSSHMESSDAINVRNSSLNLPSNPPRGLLEEIPRGWVRKLVTTGKGPRVFYYNTMGKKFSSSEEINQYFFRLGQLVKTGLFNFDPSKFNEESAKDTVNGNRQLTSQQQQQMQTVLI